MTRQFSDSSLVDRAKKIVEEYRAAHRRAVKAWNAALDYRKAELLRGKDSASAKRICESSALLVRGM